MINMNIMDTNLKGYNVKVDFGNILIDVWVNFDAHYEMTENTESHNHFAYEIHFISYGDGVLWIENQPIPLKVNNLYLIAPGVYHKFVVKQEEKIVRYSIQFNFRFLKRKSGSQFKNEILKIIEILNFNKYLVKEDLYNNFSLVESIFKELTTQRIGYIQKAELLVKDIFINIFRTICEDDIYKISNIKKGYQDEKRIPKIEQFFHAHYKQSDIRIEDLSKYLNLSVRQTQRVIKSLFGKSFREKLIEIRIENAKHLLSTTNLSIVKVSELAGFNSVNYFHYVFKEYTGMTPKCFINKSINNRKQ
ncbi:MAG TPA: AraC family transcriptional regulator [Clostridiaceae bacterium]|nr:AraC family transcriptional regulator [Clostridiaceae bacterium]